MKRSWIFWIGTITLLGILLGRLSMGLMRFFDPDEFAHMHWAYLVYSGALPYRDFFFYLTPVFQWILAPVFLLPHSETTLLFFRLEMFLLYSLSVILVYMVAKKTTGSAPAALLGTLMYAVFPMTIDKTIDVRPDIVMIITFLIPVFVLLPTVRTTALRSFCAGIVLGISFITLFKIVSLFPAILYLVLTARGKDRWKGMFFGILGILIPIALLVVWYISAGIVPQAWLAFTHDQFAVNYGKQSFSLLKTLSPWPLVYVSQGGPSIPWGVNVGMWILAIPGIVVLAKKNLRIGGFFLLVTLCVFGFLLAFPVPYVQYFMPISVFIGIAAGYAVWSMASYAAKKIPCIGYGMLGVTTAVLLLSFWIQWKERTGDQTMINEQKQVLVDILAKTKPDETIYDMTGSYVFRPDGYFICCHPYAEFVDTIASPPGTLAKSLIANQTKFLVMDQKGYVFWLPKPADLTFLLSTYTDSAYRKIYTAGVTYSCADGKCHQIDIFNNPVAGMLETKTLRIVFPERYILHTTPPGEFIILNHLKISDGQSLPLSAKLYSLQPSLSLTKFILRINR